VDSVIGDEQCFALFREFEVVRGEFIHDQEGIALLREYGRHWPLPRLHIEVESGRHIEIQVGRNNQCLVVMLAEPGLDSLAAIREYTLWNECHMTVLLPRYLFDCRDIRITLLRPV